MTNSDLNSDFAVAMQDGELTEKRIESLIKDFYPEEEVLISWLMELNTANPVDRCVEAWQLLFRVQHKHLLLRCIDVLELDYKDYLLKSKSNANTLPLQSIALSILIARKINLNTPDQHIGIEHLSKNINQSKQDKSELRLYAQGIKNDIEEPVKSKAIELINSPFADLLNEEIVLNKNPISELLMADYARPYSRSFFKRLADYLIAIDIHKSQPNIYPLPSPSFADSYFSFFHYYLRDARGALIEKIKLTKLDSHIVAVEYKGAYDELPLSFARLADKYYEEFILTDPSLTKLITGLSTQKN